MSPAVSAGRRWRRGFTLIELIATMSILGAVGTSIAFILFTAIDGYLAGHTQASLHNATSTAMERITRDLRGIGLDPAEAEPVPYISEISSTHIAWDGVNRLELLGTSLWLDGGDGPRLLLENVNGLALRAFDDDDRVALSLPRSGSDCRLIRRIEIDITVERLNQSARLRSLVYLRSTMWSGQ